MSHHRGRIRSTLLLCTALVALQGCTAAVVGTGVGTGTAMAYDRRTAGTVLDDQIIELKAWNALEEDQELSSQSHISVTSFNNVVLLTGETPSEALRERAEAIVRGVPKVRHVHNELTLSAPSAILSRSGDTWITSKVKSAMLATEGVPGTRIKVVTANGTVYLMGLVTREEAEAATETVRRIGGVQRVVKLFEYIEPPQPTERQSASAQARPSSASR